MTGGRENELDMLDNLVRDILLQIDIRKDELKTYMYHELKDRSHSEHKEAWGIMKGIREARKVVAGMSGASGRSME